MASVLESLAKKIEATTMGKIYSVESSSAKDSTKESSAGVDIEDPRHYKDIFKLDNLNIIRTLKSVLIEVKDSIFRLYYILDSSCFYVDFDCSYQVLEAIQELPVEATSYFRILFSKKAPLEIRVYDSSLTITFEDSIVKTKPPTTLLDLEVITTAYEINTTQKKRQKKEKEIAKKYTLELPLKSICELNFQVVELVEKVVSLEGYSVDKDIVGVPLNYYSIKTPNTKEFVEYCETKVHSEYGDFTIVETSGLVTTTIICPSLISNNYLKEEVLSTSLGTKTTEELSNLIPDDIFEEETFMESDSD